MRLLIDSQSLIWYVDQDHLLTPAAHAGLTDPNNDLAAQCGDDLGDLYQGRAEKAVSVDALQAGDHKGDGRTST